MIISFLTSFFLWMIITLGLKTKIPKRKQRKVAYNVICETLNTLQRAHIIPSVWCIWAAFVNNFTIPSYGTNFARWTHLLQTSNFASLAAWRKGKRQQNYCQSEPAATHRSPCRMDGVSMGNTFSLNSCPRHNHGCLAMC
jgi:hypothetical protein